MFKITIPHHAGLAIALMIGANVLFAFNDVWLRRLADETSIGLTLWARSLCFLLIVLLLRRPAAWRAALADCALRLQLLRGLAPLLASFLLIGAMGLLPIADVVACFFLSPLITACLAVLLLRERVSRWLWLALLIGMAGVLMIVRPGSGLLGMGHWLALAAAVAVAFYQILTRVVARRTDALTTLMIMAATATAVTTLLLPWTWQTPQAQHWPQLAGTAVIYGLAHGMYILALARAESARLAPFVYTQLIGSMCAAWLIYAQLPAPATLAGAAVIVAAGLVALRKPVMPLRPTAK